MKTEFRKASVADIEPIWQIILQAKEQMRLRNSRQWQNGYPNEENIIRDVEKGYGYVLCLDNCVIAYAAVIFAGEPAYENLKGEWLTNQPYVVVHRLAVADRMKQCGMATLFMQKVEELSHGNNICSFRVDTNFDNLYMQKILAKLGFTYCGEIMYQQDVRMAYEKILC
ncbi:MAG: GNAT family N-acetyltransferase [Dysgonamonadaceae bacterium]|jgi:N-acetylglutamate synthase-like GNAT family acetyltransferase|nr:GNAT family N-acetyltransferase [Dysgonamonadaceae bacterium]